MLGWCPQPTLIFSWLLLPFCCCFFCWCAPLGTVAASLCCSPSTVLRVLCCVVRAGKEESKRKSKEEKKEAVCVFFGAFQRNVVFGEFFERHTKRSCVRSNGMICQRCGQMEVRKQVILPTWRQPPLLLLLFSSSSAVECECECENKQVKEGRREGEGEKNDHEQQQSLLGSGAVYVKHSVNSKRLTISPRSVCACTPV